MKLLVTGFEPFGNMDINPAWLAVERLPEMISKWEIRSLKLPTVFGRAADMAIQAAEEWKADAVLSVGLAKGRAAVTVEMAALNLRYGRIPDNAGVAPMDEPVCPGAPAAYFATVPVRRMANAIADAGIPGEVSCSAGVFVCNDLMYSLLHHFASSPVRAGFIHVPQLPGMGTPCLPLDQIVSALIAAIQAM